ncbi:MAG: nodulation protein NfeD [Cytophagales bacterium]|nr:nodulation protein NfeD [Cytophagales bacterium]
MKKLFFICFAFLSTFLSVWAQNKVLVLDIKREIDPVTNRYVELALDKATEINADYVVVDMNTYGGGVLEADVIRTKILNYPKPIYVFINENAGSAGALISIACDSIYMSKGASIGASTVVNQEGQVVPEKYQSFMRSKMRSTAEAQGRDPKIAEGMVGNNLRTDSASVISFTTQEAIANKYCEGERQSIEDILAKNGIENPEIIRFELGETDEIISWFLNPFFKSILIMVIIGGLYFELQSPGVGFPLIASAIAVVMYFVPDYLHGLLANWELAIFFLGIVLLIIEIFVTPGFGFIGITGIVFIFSSFVLSVLNNVDLDFTFVSSKSLSGASLIFGVGLIGSSLLVVFGGTALVKSKAFQKMALQSQVEGKSSGINAEEQISIVGSEAIAYTTLRPSGKITLDGEIYDAFTRGSYIEKDEKIIIISQEGSSYKVKKA